MASQPQPAVTFAPLTQGPDITRLTIQLWLQVAFGVGFYTVGGIQAGLQLFAAQQGISANAQYLATYFSSESDEQNSGLSLPTAGGYTYKYIPATDRIQIFTPNGAEFTASEPIPPGVLSDIIVLQAIWVRL